MKIKMRNIGLLSALAVVGSGLLAGCGGTADAQAPIAGGFAAGGAPQSLGQDVDFSGVVAGIPLPPQQNPEALRSAVAGMRFASRTDPFSLLPDERAFEQRQAAERVLSEHGGFVGYFQLPDERAQDEERIEPQPYRRLSGVLVGESVLAIIDMGDGRPPRIIRPGQMIPDTEWRVVSIDADRAVLRRATGRPREIVVRLEASAMGLGSGQQQPGMGAPGRGEGGAFGPGRLDGGSSAGAPGMDGGAAR
jgi:hypothetical protein